MAGYSKEHQDRFRQAAAKHIAGEPHEDREAAGWVKEIEDLYLLCQFFSGFDSVELAKARYGDLVEQALIYMRAKAAAEQETAWGVGSAAPKPDRAEIKAALEELQREQYRAARHHGFGGGLH